jgi:C4-dicarboxylate-specific signal transduction histidine kinase
VNRENTEELKEEIISLSKLTRTGLDKKVARFMKLYDRQTKQNRLILQQSDKRYAQIRHLNDELEVLKSNLEERVEQEIHARMEKEKLLKQQAKMAAMGEMMDAVAHQWKQPLNALSMLTDLLQSDFRTGAVDQAYVDTMSESVHQQIEHMVTTLNEFRTFFRPNKEAEPFGLKRCLQGVALLVKDEFMKNGITIHIESGNEIIVNGVENELKHLILNIINNAKDAFNERGCSRRDIFIRFDRKGRLITLEIEDNAGGIPDAVINDIFKPNVTTKEEGKGTGIGLYMSAQIAQKLHGSLSVRNSERGALFTLTVTT